MKVGIYHTLGDGGIEGSLAVLEGAVRGGASLLEVGLPFSDPLLDGPVVQASHTRALRKGAWSWEVVCDALAELRRRADAAAKAGERDPSDVKISVMTSAQLLYTDSRRARLPRVDGLLVTDIEALAPCPFPLPSPRVWFLSQDVALGAADLKAPEPVGMVYLTRLQGVTGAGQKASPETKAAVERIRNVTQAPLWLGFGISERRDVLEASAFGVDGVVIGSAFVRALEAELTDAGEGKTGAAEGLSAKAAAWVKGVMPALIAGLTAVGADVAAGGLGSQGNSVAYAQEARRMGINYTVDLIHQLAGLEPREKSVNPNNVARIPKGTALLQLRPDVNVDFGRRFAVAARPRFAWDYSLIDAADSPLLDAPRKTTRRATLEVRWQELFGTVIASESLSVTYGIQNYQWGSAESFSPTNILYPNPEFDRGLYFEQGGKEMVRANLSAGQWGSLVLLGKPERGAIAGQRNSSGRGSAGTGSATTIGSGAGAGASNSAGGAAAGATSLEPRARREGSIVVAKGELSWNNGSDSVGLVLAGGDKRKPGFGETVSVNLTDALLVFGEGFHSREPQGLVVREATVPVPRAPAGTPPARVDLLDRPGEDDSRALETVALAGFRWGFSGGSEFRVEGLYNSGGLDRQELSDAYETTKGNTAIAARNTAVLIGSSQELLAEWAAFTSARIVELPPAKAVTLYARATVFPADGSYVALASLEYAWKDDATLFGTYLNSDPREESFAMNAAKQAGTLGVKVTW